MRSTRIKLHKIGKEFLKKFKSEIEDIILFGSFMRGKKDAADVDLLIIFKKNINKKIEQEFKRIIGIPNVDINSITLQELKGEGFIAKEGVYLEGISLISDKPVGESIGFVSVAFIQYDLSEIKGSLRIRFYYALQGRNNKKGFLSEVGAKRYADNVVVCDYTTLDIIKPFFEHWRIPYRIIPALIPKRLKHILLQ